MYMSKVVDIKELKGNMISRNNSNKLDGRIGADVNGNVYKVVDSEWQLLKPSITKRGYQLVFTEGYTFPVQDVVYAVFNSPIRKGCVIHHVDGNKVNNTPSNLQMITRSENVHYFFSNATGENNSLVGQTQYRYSLDEMIGSEFFVELPQYSLKISNKGNIINTRTNREAKAVANIKYPTNLIVSCYNEDGKHTTVSLSRLFAEAFMITPDTKYKVLIRNQSDNLKSPLNYYLYINEKAVA